MQHIKRPDCVDSVGGAGAALQLLEPTAGLLLINSAAYGHETIWAIDTTAGAGPLPVIPTQLLRGATAIATTTPGSSSSPPMVAVLSQSPDSAPALRVYPAAVLLAGAAAPPPSGGGGGEVGVVWPSAVLPSRLTGGWQDITVRAAQHTDNCWNRCLVSCTTRARCRWSRLPAASTQPTHTARSCSTSQSPRCRLRPTPQARNVGLHASLCCS